METIFFKRYIARSEPGVVRAVIGALEKESRAVSVVSA